MMQQPTAENIVRNSFGAITQMPNYYLCTATELLAKAIESKKLANEYIVTDYNFRRGKCIGSCLNYDVYDVNDATVLVQQRETEMTKYGKSCKKKYYLIRRCGQDVVIDEASKFIVMKLSKIATKLGEVIDTLNKKTENPLKLAGPFSKKRIAYKVVEIRDGKLFSIFDDSFEWEVGKAKIEASTNDHKGGFYVYPNIELAKSQLEKGVVFNPELINEKRLALIECEISGRQYVHDNSKICVSFCRPIKIIEELN